MNAFRETPLRPVLSSYAPIPAGHYSQAIEHAGLVYVSGQLPLEPYTEMRHVGNIEDQTEQALHNLEAILRESGSDKGHVLKVTIYISDITLWDRVNAVYARFFGPHRPARSIVPTRELHFGFQIELDAIAAVRRW